MTILFANQSKQKCNKDRIDDSSRGESTPKSSHPMRYILIFLLFISAAKSYANTKTSGLQLDHSIVGTVYEKIGLQPGDRILAIDGKALGPDRETIHYLESLQDKTKLLLKIERAGSIGEFHITIRK